MFSLKILLVALLVTIALSLRMLGRIGSGREIVTVRRQSNLSPKATWGNLLHAWQETGLTFRAARIVEGEDGFRTILPTGGGEMVIQALEAPTDRSIVLRVVSVDGEDYLPDVGHFEHWRVEPVGNGATVIVETRFRASLVGTVQTLWGLWKQAGLVAAPGTTPVLGDPPGSADKAAATPRQEAPQPAGYGREAIMSLLAFGYLLTQYRWQNAVVLVLVILWHEYGHLLAYQLTGRRGNRLMLVPLFGGVAVAGAPHRNEFQRAFCALMGPGICAPLTLGAFGLWYYDMLPDYDPWLRAFFYFSAVLNLLNLLPIYPLDGGQAMESFLRSYFPSSINVHLTGLSVAGVVVLAGLGYHQMALFVGLFSLFGLRNLPAHSPLPPMSGGQAAAMAVFYALIVAAHGWVYYSIS
jgi:Zn-dependent protease